ncbi:MAG: hypothetical protein HN846_04590 [Candidatus Pacebacteria bacterium]|nr:hypothetical protein [Candidatus Paceibacterota bacterium]MBT3512220.1 hypothetical protein [Candidatus Paceibacterota bacterium]MBT4004550.1 hypothetical protein [Candidatus Paceibacterota bacterium]MBT4359202.1 hypothetical protein [Candidatus Paceibacterota bacterium]MBT4681088.1 hypothetical protein [Candidatus Paceibacterota bacterium]
MDEKGKPGLYSEEVGKEVDVTDASAEEIKRFTREAGVDVTISRKKGKIFARIVRFFVKPK